MSTKVTAVAVPLVEAVIEVRFPGDARLEALRGDFQSRIRDRYPHLAVPLMDSARAPALQHYRFVNAAGTEFVGLALNSFIYSTREYPGWDAFLEIAKSLWSEIPDFSPETLSRVGLRYINEFHRESLSKVQMDEPHGLLESIRAKPRMHRSVSVFEDKDDTLTVNLEYIASTPRLIIDYDCSRDSVTPNDMWMAAGSLHDRVEREFFSVLAPEYLEELRG